MSEMVPVPEQIARQIAMRAVEIARVIGPRKTGKALLGLTPISQEGIIGIDASEEVSYILDLDQGIEEHPMTNLAGRNVPVRSPGGTIFFRRATENNIGTIPIITRLSKDGRIYNGKPEWTYPAKPGLNFIQRSLEMSVDEWCRSANTQKVVDMMLLSSIKDDVSMFVYGKKASV